MRTNFLTTSVAALVLCNAGTALAASANKNKPIGLDQIETIVVIYAENRSFDNLYGFFPRANGLQNLKPEQYQQRDLDGTLMKELPPIWDGLTNKYVSPGVPEDKTKHLRNEPFAIDGSRPKGLNLPVSVRTRDLWHLFYQHQMQINGGKNDMFAAYSDSGALVMGHYKNVSKLPLWNIARQYTLADNFFMGAFGGSFLNHFWLVCACTPKYPNADQKAPKRIAELDDKGRLKLADDSPKSAITAPVVFKTPWASITPGPDFHAVNTHQPPFQPSGNKPPRDGNHDLADSNEPSTLPRQDNKTIGDLLSAKSITWAWYAGAWQAAINGDGGGIVPNFQYHHQPFNYFTAMAPDTEAGKAVRKEHLRDGGINGIKFIEAIDKGDELPQVTFYKPQGNLNQHPDYADVLSGEQHIANVIAHLRLSPKWKNMMIIVTYDENGGFWDHVPPPKGDRWGPGSRVPAIIISPFAKRNCVDPTQYDTTSIMRFLIKRFDLDGDKITGLKERDDALKANGEPPMGNLMNTLIFSPSKCRA